MLKYVLLRTREGRCLTKYISRRVYKLTEQIFRLSFADLSFAAEVAKCLSATFKKALDNKSFLKKNPVIFAQFRGR